MRLTSLLWLLATGSAGFGIYMIAAPGSWYETVPGVTQTGPFNGHFVRDVGVAYVTLALATGFAAARPGLRLAMLILVAANSVLHAALHLIETVGSSHPHPFNPAEAALVHGGALVAVTVLFWVRRTQKTA